MMTLFFCTEPGSKNIRFGRILFVCCLCLYLSACGGGFRHLPPEPKGNLGKIPDAEPSFEPKSPYGNPPTYEVFGKRYWVLPSGKGYVEQGIASWYGKKFHGKRASSGETYDMYQMTAAHKTLPLPSYVEVTNLRNGRKIVVRVNDRGPFHENRIIDLSYVAALKLDIVKEGTGMVEVRTLSPEEYDKGSRRKAVNSVSTTAATGNVTKVAAATSTATRLPESAIRNVPVTSGVSQAKTETRSGQTRTEKQAVETGLNFGSQRMYIQLGAFSDKNNADQLRSKTQAAINRMVAVHREDQQGKSLYKVRIGPIADVATSDRIVHALNQAGMYEHRIVFQ